MRAPDLREQIQDLKHRRICGGDFDKGIGCVGMESVYLSMEKRAIHIFDLHERL